MGRTWPRRPLRRNPAHAKEKRRAYTLRACCSTPARLPHAPGCQRHPRMCGNKAAFERPSEAAQQSRDLEGKTGVAFRVYRCPWCCLLHLTTQKE